MFALLKALIMFKIRIYLWQSLHRYLHIYNHMPMAVHIYICANTMTVWRRNMIESTQLIQYSAIDLCLSAQKVVNTSQSVQLLGASTLKFISIVLRNSKDLRPQVCAEHELNRRPRCCADGKPNLRKSACAINLRIQASASAQVATLNTHY